jgi:ElaB/YqjD/DUF883 family membrane-anchored ribosome-binding protein
MTESTVNDAARALAEEARGLRDAARAAARRARTVGNAEVENLISDVEELIARLADTADPAIARLRSRVTDTVRSTRRAIAGSAAHAQRQAREVLSAGDSYVREQPWEAVGAAVLVGVIVGLLVFRR